MTTRTGWCVPGYVEVRELGAGAQGRAVLVRHERSGEAYVIKYLSSKDDLARQLFARESELLRSVSSPYVARWFGHVDNEATCAILMEAVDGVSLKEVLQAHGRLAPEAALVVLKGSLLGMDAAHRIGIVHRDYKPANVVVQRDGASKLIDFGVATLAGTAGRTGTPLYMAPEQWLGQPVTPATDVYAATCVFYECVTGTRPFAGTQESHLNDVPALEGVPPQLHGLVTAGLARAASQRPARAAGFVSTLESAAAAAYGADWEKRGAAALAGAAASLGGLFLLSAGGSAAAAPSSATTAVKGWSAGKAALAAAVGAAVVIAGGATFYFAKSKPATKAEPLKVSLASFTQNYPDTKLSVTNAPYPQVTGVPDAALGQRINAALREPLDWQTRVYNDWIKENGFPDCLNTGSKLNVKVTLGLQGPEFVSARYLFDQDTECWQPGSFMESVTVDLSSGRALQPSDMFTPAALSGGLAKAVCPKMPADRACKQLFLEPALSTREGLTGTQAELTWASGRLEVTAGVNTADDQVTGPLRFANETLKALLLPTFATRL